VRARPEPDAPASRGGSAWSGLLGLTVLVLAVLLARRPLLGWVVFGGLLLGAVGLLFARRGGDGADHSHGGRRVVAGLVGVAAAAVAVRLWPVLGGLGVGLAGLLILWGLVRRVRGHERTEAVKPPPAYGSPEEVGERWQDYVHRARLHDYSDEEQAARLIRDPAPNGVGGIVARVDLRQAGLLPEDLDRTVDMARRVLRIDRVFTRRVDTDTVDLHLYRGTPLADPIRYQWLAGNAAAGERATVGATATAQPAVLRWRLSVGWFGATAAGKTTGQLALLHSITAVRHIPTHLLVLDNRTEEDGRGSELAVLAGLPGVVYRDRSVDAWELVCRALDIMSCRHAGKGLGEVQPSGEYPLVRLMVTELQDVVDSRPPRDVQDWTSYSRGRFDSRPSDKDWRDMLASGLGEIVRKGRDVAVVLDAAAQAAQIDVIPAVLRRVLPQAVLFRVMHDSDIKPALGDGADVEAHLIPEWQQGAGYLRGENGRSVFFRAAHIGPEHLAEAVVEPVREWGRRVLYVVDGMEETG